MNQLKNYVDGQWVATSHKFNDINPVNAEVVAEVHEADKELVDTAVLAAKKSLTGQWGKISISERSAFLYEIADEIDRRFKDFLEAEIADTGKPVSMASKIDIPRGAANFRIFADIIKNALIESYKTDLADGHALNYAVRKPVGVVAVISPWNLPLLLLTWKVAPALACGNAVIAKPSEETPATATLLAEVMHTVGLPPGVFNLVHGFGPASAGEFLSSHPDIDAITFTGESNTGSIIMHEAAKGIKPVSFELGGKNAAIIFADCDREKMFDGMLNAIYLNAGQVCLNAERVYVERSFYQEFSNELVKRVKQLKLGWPDDSSTNMGPLISAEHKKKVLGYFQLAKEEGAVFHVGGGIPKFGDVRDNGFWVEPTVISGLPESARCIKEEIFGPICHITPFDTEEQAIAMANDTHYGLASTIWTTNLSKGHRVAEAMHVGLSWVNCWFLRDLKTPFGGAGLSGIGREGGVHSLNFYSEITNICIKIDRE